MADSKSAQGKERRTKQLPASEIALVAWNRWFFLMVIKEI